jgi:hypothetical protein
MDASFEASKFKARNTSRAEVWGSKQSQTIMRIVIFGVRVRYVDGLRPMYSRTSV